MKRLFNFFILTFATLLSLQAQTIPSDSAVYRLISGRDNLAMTEDISAHSLYCVPSGGDKSYNQLWMFTKSGTGWNIQNVFTGRYVQKESAVYAVFKTAATPREFYVKNHSAEGYKNIVNDAGGNWGLHCQADNTVVPWSASTGTPGGSEWKFEEVALTVEQFSEARRKYDEFNKVLDNKDSIISAYPAFFEDDMCTVLKSEYTAMSDEELSAAMGAFGETLINVALKIKNNSWTEREKEFRVHSYEAYSDPDYWAEKINTKKYSWLNNPTGIYANSSDVVYVFVGAEPAEGTTLQIDAVSDVSPSGTRTELKKGMNIVPVSRDAQSLFIIYTADTSGDKVLADFEPVPIHIEGGVLNGYWDKSRHTDADWVDITQNLATHPYFTVKGDNHIFFMSLKYMTASNCCRNTISDAIGWWDDMSRWQQEIMGIEEFKPSRFNNKQCAISLTSGYQSATDYRTQYAETYITNLLPYKNVMAYGDNVWGPAHENGHVHQYGINMIANSEVSNNLFSNLTLYKMGRYMSRGGKISEIADGFVSNTPYQKRDGGVTLRMFWQLYLYYHVAGNNPEFYPTLFKLLREDRMSRKSGTAVNYGNKDLLLFAEKCCEAAGEDLSDFFEAWGFFIPMNRVTFDDYGSYILTSTQNMINNTKSKMAEYPKRAGAIKFIEDRVKYVKRTDGVNGNKLTNGVAVGQAGDVGHYTDFVKDSMNVNAAGYIYSKAGKVVTISKGSGAVGFNIYDAADTTLLTFANTFEFELSDEMAGKEIIIAAVSANGTEAVVNSKNNGSEEDQLEALGDAITAAQNILKFKDSGSKYVGYYYESALLVLTSLVESATAARDNKDQAEHSYGEWATLIDEEMNSILSNEDAKVKIRPENSYQMKNKQYSGYSMFYNSGSIICKSGSSQAQARAFKFKPTNKANEYYISSNGKYISSVTTSVLTKAEKSTTTGAIKFTVGEVGDGTFYIEKTDGNMQSLHCDASKNVVGWNSSANASHWQILCVDLVKEKADIASLSALVDEADSIYYAIVDDTVNTTFKEGVEVTSETLAADVVSMMALVDESETVISKKYYELCPELIASLTDAIAKVKSGYSVTTGINGILFDDEDAVIYDIRGRRIDKITSSGFYIVNGKKVYVE